MVTGVPPFGQFVGGGGGAVAAVGQVAGGGAGFGGAAGACQQAGTAQVVGQDVVHAIITAGRGTA